MAKLKISGIVNDSIVDGPGLRYSIFTQGCPHHCPGCHNPQTHPFKGGKSFSLKKFKKAILDNPLLTGVTFSGGDPFAQAKALIPYAKFVKERGLELAVYTGYLFEQLNGDSIPYAKELLSYVDVLIDGKFVLSQKSLNLKFKGSKNQRTIDVPESLKSNKVIISKNEKWV